MSEHVTKSFTEFLEALLRFESAMDPATIIPALKDPGHRRNYFKLKKDANGHVIPGHLVRDEATGKAIPEKNLTLKEYFEYLDLSAEYKHLEEKLKAGAPDHELAEIIDAAAYRCVNYLGFIGFQVGEGVLIESGYYDPDKLPGDGADSQQMLPAYYYWVDDESVFAHGNEDKEIKPEGFSKPLIATSYNRWQGEFTGLDGLTGPAGRNVDWRTKIETLRTKDVQQNVIRAVMRSNLDTLIKRMASTGESRTATLERILKLSFHKSADAASEKLTPTISGLLAGAHLRGASGLAQDLNAGHPVGSDETGTTSFDYVKRFNGYETPFDSPGDREFLFHRDYPELLDAGLGNLKVWFTPSHLSKEKPIQVRVDLDNDKHTTLELMGFNPKLGDTLRFLHRLSVDEVKKLTQNANTITSVPGVVRESSGAIPKNTAVHQLENGAKITVKNVTVIFGGATLADVEKWVSEGQFSLSTGYPFGWGEVGANANEPVYVADDVFSVRAGDFFYPDPTNSGGLNLHLMGVDSYSAGASKDARGPLKDKPHVEVTEEFVHYGLVFSEKSERHLTARNFVGFAGAPKYSNQD